MNTTTTALAANAATTHSKKPSLRVATLLAAGLLLGVGGVTSGCLAVAAGAGAGAAVAYVRGDLDATLNANFDRAVWAANQGVTNLQFVKVSEKKDALRADLLVRTAADKKIQIRIDRVGDTMSKVKIRVGTFGDESLSLAILEKIKANLAP